MLKNIMTMAAIAIILCSCGDKSLKSFKELPDNCKPETVGNMVIAQFLTGIPESYAPQGYDGNFAYGRGKTVTYPLVSLWINALEFARNTGNDELEKKLTDHFEPYFNEKKDICSVDNHVDYSVFGALPLEIYLINGDQRALELGMHYADHQWEAPDSTSLGGNGNFDYATQVQLHEQGYTPQTRLWIDDMYMINALQSQAYRVTGDVSYIKRAAKEMVLYLDTLQLENGLFNHAPDVPFAWGRGCGWMAAGMPMLLKYLPADDENYNRIMEGYLKMMETLLACQHESGMWGQIVDDPEFWDESSCTGMFTYAFVEGIKQGWLDETIYGPAARKAWIALCNKLDEYGNVSDVCVGTNRFNDRDYYFQRPRFNGDPHGQAAIVWISNALVSK